MSYHNHAKPVVFRLVAWAFVPAQMAFAVPVRAAVPERGQAPPVDEAAKAPELPRAKVNVGVPAVKPPAALPDFSPAPTDEEIFRARVFEEPLVAIGSTSAAENHALATAITEYATQTSREDVGALESFLREYPASAWRASLLADLGVVYRRTGYISKALGAWREAWEASRAETEPHSVAVADVALSQLATLNARLGRTADLEALLEAAKGRNVRGSAAERLDEARESLWLLKNRPQRSFRCGPLALAKLVALARNDDRPDPMVSAFKATPDGTSLLQMRDLGVKVGLKVRIAKRAAGSAVLSPAIVHWKAGHFAAVVREEGARYLVLDPTFGDEIWMSRRALDEEGTGYFLVMDRRLPQGWESVEDEEGGRVWGKGAPPNPNPNNQTPCEENTSNCSSCGASGQTCPSCASQNNGPPSSGLMPTYTMQTMMLNLHITDTPVAYAPAVGPNVAFSMTYNAKEVFQPQTFAYSNLGPKWTFNWLSYVQDDPSNLPANVSVYLRGGGVEPSTTYNDTTKSYAPQPRSGAVIKRTSSSPITYERRLRDGSVEVYSLPNGVATPRKVFLTAFSDPAGNTVSLSYDQYFRLVQVADPMGQITTLTYGLSDTYKITAVTDPFGRSASFSYNSAGELSQITDVAGLSSQFTYGAGDFISAMTTPYGTSTFLYTPGLLDAGDFPSLQATDPMGGTEMLSFDVDDAAPGIPGSETLVPTGFANFNYNLFSQTTYYWDKRAMALHPGDFTKARATHWLYETNLQVSGIKHSEKAPLENRVWYGYQGQYLMFAGTQVQPNKVARVLDDDGSGPVDQITQYQYNAVGQVTKTIDPLLRETDFFYGTNNVVDPDQTTGTGVDLLQVKQKNGTGFDVLQTTTYNALHEPLTVTDAAGQTTTYTYDTRGRVRTMVTPPRKGPDGTTDLTAPERTTTYAYYPDTPGTVGAGRLQSVTGPSSPQGSPLTTFSYDTYGRARTASEQAGSLVYTTTTDYDLADRPIKVTHPDGTYEQLVWDKLDLHRRRDRMGRWTQMDHDAVRHLVATRDPAGRVTTLGWCVCGSLEKLTDANGNATTWQRDLQGRTVQEIRADGKSSFMTYENATSRLRTRTDARGQLSTYHYFVDDRLKRTEYTNPAVTPTVSFAYDPVYDRLASMTDGIGTTYYHFNDVTPAALGAGRLSYVDSPVPGGGTARVSYSYDELGRLKTRGLTNPTSFVSTMAYDSLGRLAKLTAPPAAGGAAWGDFAWGYQDATGRPFSLAYPNGQVTSYSYFGNNFDQRLQQIKHQQVASGSILSQFDYTYDSVGNILTWQQQLGASAAKKYEYGYDPADQLVSVVQKDAATQAILKNFGYAYDAAGNRTVNAQDAVASTGTYNNRNQLVSQAGGAALPVAGLLNEGGTVTVNTVPAAVDAGNKFSGSAPVGTGPQTLTVKATDVSGNVRTSTYSVTVSGTPQTYAYDANGNLCSTGGTNCANGTTTYEWDAENRLVDVKQGSTVLATFLYDGQGRRVQKTAGGVTHLYIYDMRGIVEERLSSGQRLDYVEGPGIDQHLAQRDQADVQSYFLADHLASIVQMTNSVGTATLTREYDPWGNIVQGSSVSGYAFTGREWDAETGLHYYRARYYDPGVGRFISEDPLRQWTGMASYRYAMDNPVGQADPSGLMTMKECLHLASEKRRACEETTINTFHFFSQFCRDICRGLKIPNCVNNCLRPWEAWTQKTLAQCRETYEKEAQICRDMRDPTEVTPPLCISI